MAPARFTCATSKSFGVCCLCRPVAWNARGELLVIVWLYFLKYAKAQWPLWWSGKFPLLERRLKCFTVRAFSFGLLDDLGVEVLAVVLFTLICCSFGMYLLITFTCFPNNLEISNLVSALLLVRISKRNVL